MSEILSFKAGRVQLDEATKRATPLAGKGLVRVARNEDDPTLVSLVWEPRGSAPNDAPVDGDREELLLFPGDAQWVHYKKCTTGRVFALKFSSSGDRLLFWLQEDNGKSDPGLLSAADKQIATTLNKLLDVTEEEKEDSMAVDSTTETTAVTTVTDGSSALNPDLSALLRSIRIPSSSAPQASSASSNIPILSITDALPISKLVAHVQSLPESALDPYYEFMPEGFEHTREELVKVLQSPHFFSGVESLSSVFRDSAGIGSLVASQLGYPYQGEGIEGFLNGARESGRREREQQQQQQEQEQQEGEEEDAMQE